MQRLDCLTIYLCWATELFSQGGALYVLRELAPVYIATLADLTAADKHNDSVTATTARTMPKKLTYPNISSSRLTR